MEHEALGKRMSEMACDARAKEGSKMIGAPAGRRFGQVCLVMLLALVLGGAAFWTMASRVAQAQGSSANLSLVKVDAPDLAKIDYPLTYTIVVTNNGPDNATGVILTDTMPVSVTFNSVTPSQGSCGGTAPVTCTLGNLANGATATVTLVVTPTAVGTITNIAEVLGNEADPNTGNNTTSLTTPVFNPGPALMFDGSDDYVSINTNTFDGLTDVTVSAWVKLDIINHPSSDAQTIISALKSGTAHYFTLMIQDDGNLASHIAAGSCSLVTTSSPVSETDTWYHIAVVKEDQDLRLYVNGELISSSSNCNGAIAENTGDTRIGSQHPGDRYLDGLIDEVRLWDVAHTQAEIQSTMDRPLAGNEPGLIGYWKFDENSDQVANDSSGTGNTGQLGSTSGTDSNDPTWTEGFIPILYPDLRLTLAGPSEAPVGTTVNYELSVQNNGYITAPQVVLTHTLPLSIVYAGASISPTSAASPTLVWELAGSLAPLESRDLVVTGTVHPSATLGSALLATATVTSALTETNLANNSAAFTSTVVPGLASQLVLTTPIEVDLLIPFSVTVAAYDAYGNRATGYTGTVVLTNSGVASGFPVSHPFAPADQGVYTFTNLTLKTAGLQHITVTAGALSQTAGITVDDSLVIVNQDTVWDETGITLGTLVVTGTDTVLTLEGATVITAENMTIGEGARVSADGQGYGSHSGPGAGGSIGSCCGGAGGGAYGGYGGIGSSQVLGGEPYGDYLQPAELGSGGGRTSEQTSGGNGGGAIKLVADNLTVDGSITVNGKPGISNPNAFPDRAPGGGSGGSIWLEVAAAITGSGSLEANGGSGVSAPWGPVGGGGSGGRIAIYCSDCEFVDAAMAAHRIQAYGGWGYQYGGPGTIYINEPASVDLLLVDNQSVNSREAKILTGTHQFDTLKLTRSGHLEVGGDLTLLADSLQGDNSAQLTVTGTLTATEVVTFHGADIVAQDRLLVSNTLRVHTSTLDVQGELIGAADVTIDQAGTLRLQAGAYPSGTLTLTELDVVSGTLSLAAYDSGDTNYGDDYGFVLSATQLTVSPQGIIEANGLGYQRTDINGGPGASPDGASHGGYGGGDEDLYGNLYQPSMLGSSGNDGRGGGAVRLVVSDTLTLNGQVQANGISDGSGGSIWLQVGESLTGSGQVQAKGGSEAGGGGRIAVYAVNDNTYTGSYVADFGGGVCPSQRLCGGSIYLDGVDPLTSTFVISPTSIPANGVAAGMITVTLRTITGALVAGEPVSLTLRSGDQSHTFINGLHYRTLFRIG